MKHEITFEQYALCYMLHEDEYELSSKGDRLYKQSGPSIANMYKYVNNIRKWKKAEIQELVDKGFLKRSGKYDSPDLLQLEKSFAKALFIHMSDLSSCLIYILLTWTLVPEEQRVY